jgi:hypothetical protein
MKINIDTHIIEADNITMETEVPVVVKVPNKRAWSPTLLNWFGTVEIPNSGQIYTLPSRTGDVVISVSDASSQFILDAWEQQILTYACGFPTDGIRVKRDMIFTIDEKMYTLIGCLIFKDGDYRIKYDYRIED